MKAVYPVTLYNASLYVQLAKLFEKMGPNREHDLYLVTCPAALEHAQTFAESVKRLFRTVEIGILPNIVEKTNAGRNAMFRDAVWMLEKAGNASAWVWMENAYPIHREWMTMIQEEWNAKPLDRFYLGCTAKTFLPAVDAEGKLITGEGGEARYKPSTPYMRFGVYPADFHRRSAILKGLANLPFEIALRDEIVPVCHESDSLATLWASKNYRLLSNGCRYIGEQSPEFEPEIRKNEKTSVDTEGVAVLHGCRDGSLGMVLLGQHWNKIDRPSKRVRGASDEDSGKIADLEAQIADLKARLAGRFLEDRSTDQANDEGAVEVAIITVPDDGDNEVIVTVAPDDAVTVIAPVLPVESGAVIAETNLPEPSPNAAPPKRGRGRPKKLIQA